MPRKPRETQRSTQQNPTSLSAAELSYVKSQHAVESVITREDARRTLTQARIVEHELELLNEQLITAEARVTEADHQVNTEKKRADSAEADNAELQSQIAAVQSETARIRDALEDMTRERDALQTELEKAQSSQSDAATVLSEKLSLAREVADMRPELEDLRCQVINSKNLRDENLSLQQEAKDMQVELEETRQQHRRLEKQDEKRSRKIESLEQGLEDYKQKLEEALEAVKSADKDHTQTSKEKVAAVERSKHEEVEAVKNELYAEQKERQRLERTHAKESQSWDADKAVLDDKLSQFRTKLRSTKDKLKETEAELENARAASTTVHAPTQRARTAKNPRKRTASESVDPDAAIGTPGDGHANKRVKRASSIIGEKSNFSITPLLNKTVSVQAEGADVPVESVEDDSPSTRVENSAKISKVALAPSSAGKSNLKIKSKRSVASATTLEDVAEEDESNDENTVPTTMKPKNKSEKPMKTVTKPTLKPRKSLTNFTTFRESSLQPGSRPGSIPPAQKKKRKLLGSAGAKTLFDDEEDGDATEGSKTSSKATLSGLGGQRAFGTFKSGLGGIGGSLLSKRRGPLQSADGFAFSPLKKERRAMAAASRLTSEAPGV